MGFVNLKFFAWNISLGGRAEELGDPSFGFS